MTRKLRTHWIVWGSLVLGVVVGTAFYLLSSSATITSVELTPDTAIDVSVFRPLSDVIRLSLEFERPIGQGRQELGEYTLRGDWRLSGFLDFVDPGIPIKLSVRGDGKEVIYEAMPASRYGRNTIGRDLVPFGDDGNPNRFQWPPDHTLQHNLSAGFSHFRITVQEVGDQLKGEKVNLIIQPPVTLKAVASHYGGIAWFVLWPLYALLLLAYGLVLLWQTNRPNPNAPADRGASPLRCD